MRQVPGKPTPLETLRERQQNVHMLRELMESPEWTLLTQHYTAEYQRAAGVAHRVPLETETPYQRYYNLGVAHGMRILLDLPGRLVQTLAITEEERAHVAQGASS